MADEPSSVTAPPVTPVAEEGSRGGGSGGSSACRVAFSAALGIGVAMSSALWPTPIYGLAAIVLWPVLFLAAGAAGFVAWRWLPLRKLESRGAMIAWTAVLSAALLALPWLWALSVVQSIEATELIDYPGAERLELLHGSLFPPAFIGLRETVKGDQAEIFAFYRSHMIARGWTLSNESPFMQRWEKLDQSMDILHSRGVKGMEVSLLWNRKLDSLR
jgi:hypothetical protein